MHKPSASGSRSTADFAGDDATSLTRRTLSPALSRCLGLPMACSSRVEWLDAARQRDAALAAVEAASDHVNVEGFVLDAESEIVAAALLRACARGVHVNLVGTDVPAATWPRMEPLHRAGVRLAGLPALPRSPLAGRRRRLLVVDGAIAMLAAGDAWLRIAGPAAGAVQALFVHDWLASAVVALPPARYFPMPPAAGTDGIGLAGADAFERAGLAAIGAAQQRIAVSAMDMLSPAQSRALDEATSRGVEVRVAAAAQRPWWRRRTNRPLLPAIVIDGVWSCIAAGRHGRTDVRLIVLGPGLGASVERAIAGDLAAGRP